MSWDETISSSDLDSYFKDESVMVKAVIQALGDDVFIFFHDRKVWKIANLEDDNARSFEEVIPSLGQTEVIWASSDQIYVVETIESSAGEIRTFLRRIDKDGGITLSDLLSDVDFRGGFAYERDDQIYLTGGKTPNGEFLSTVYKVGKDLNNSIPVPSGNLPSLVDGHRIEISNKCAWLTMPESAPKVYQNCEEKPFENNQEAWELFPWVGGSPSLASLSVAYSKKDTVYYLLGQDIRTGELLVYQGQEQRTGWVPVELEKKPPEMHFIKQAFMKDAHMFFLDSEGTLYQSTDFAKTWDS